MWYVSACPKCPFLLSYFRLNSSGGNSPNSYAFTSCFNFVTIWDKGIKENHMSFDTLSCSPYTHPLDCFSCSLPCFYPRFIYFSMGWAFAHPGRLQTVTHAPHANVRVHVPRATAAIDGTATATHAVVPTAAANEGAQGCL